ncbi:MAG: beta-L-arabinofuranosidase domain-containing protein, partial [Anaerolineaceae bacterium]
RGRIRGLPLLLLRQNDQVEKRKAAARGKREAYWAAHPQANVFRLPAGNPYRAQFGSGLRRLSGYLTGKYFQQHAPVRRQLEPVGHAVRFAYFETAAAMLARLTGDHTLTAPLEQTWQRMVTRRMYVTGGLGSVPVTEGFGRDYELDPQFAYAETCAALGSMFWSWEMAQLTGSPAYSDLFEWQLYNAALVGMSADGRGYFYNNPLLCRGDVVRQPWFEIPCCPSNISRTWANLGQYIAAVQPGRLVLHQYIASRVQETIPLPDGSRCTLTINLGTGLPWQGWATLTVEEAAYSGQAQPFELLLRRPSWAASMQVRINGEPLKRLTKPEKPNQPTASGFDPRTAVFQPLQRAWQTGDVLEISYDMPARLLSAHPRVKGHKGRAAVTRGPLVYCLENIDQPDVDIFTCRLDPASLTPSPDPAVPGGLVRLLGKTAGGEPLTLIPYFWWGNRGPSQMTVWVSISS